MVTSDYASRKERYLFYLFIYLFHLSLLFLHSLRFYESKLEIVDAEKRKAVKQLQRYKVLNVEVESS